MARGQIVVIGGGIAGLVAARALERRQYACTLIEPRTNPDGGAGLMLWASALRALTRLGIPEVNSLGMPIRESILRDQTGRTLLRIPLGLSRRTLPRAVPRQSLMQLLSRNLRCGIIPQSCTGIHLIGDRYGINLADNRTIEADGILIASGMNSPLRQFVSKESKPRGCKRNSWRGLVAFEDARLASGVSVETIGRGCRVGLFSVGGGLIYWFVQTNENDAAERPDSPRISLADRFANWPEPIPRIIAATPESAIIETPITEMLPAPVWRDGKALLIGDAAHGMAPDLGRGACTAIVNLLGLDRQLARQASFDGAATAYTRARRWRTLLIQHASRIAGSVRQTESHILYAVRNTFWRYFPPLLILRLIITPLLSMRLKYLYR